MMTPMTPVTEKQEAAGKMEEAMADTWEAFKTDLRFIIKTRGPLRIQPFIRSHFWRRLRELQGKPL